MNTEINDCIKAKKDISSYLPLQNIDETDGDGFTYLMIAILVGNYECVKLLTEHKANVNLTVTKNKNTPLLLSMIKYTKTYDKDNLYQQEKINKILLKNGADINYISKNSKNALSLSIEFKDIYLLKFLIKNKANVNFKFKNGITLFKYAMENNDVLILQLLFKAGMDYV